MVEFFLPSCLVTLILLVWFKSAAFEEYSKLFGLSSLFYVDAYQEGLKKNPVDTYQDFLLKNFSCFAIKLVTCPLCLSVWVSMIVALSINSFYFFPIYNIIGLILYGTTNKVMEE